MIVAVKATAVTSLETDGSCQHCAEKATEQMIELKAVPVCHPVAQIQTGSLIGFEKCPEVLEPE